MLIWPSLKIILLSPNIAKIQGARHTRPFLRDGSSGSILNWLHLYDFSVFLKKILSYKDKNYLIAILNF